MGSQSRWRPFAALFKSSKPVPAKPQPARDVARIQHPFHAVSILPGPGACDSARRFKGLRFLSKDAPRLPLPTCNAAQCNCRFKHHADRRAGPRRRTDQGMMSGPWNGTERRRTGGRRAEDH
ncbi:MAG TPA: hypothetical protein VKB34_06870 [Povalibacter sp.]|nr:hypothetical protein [Povalibacter sp.]